MPETTKIKCKGINYSITLQADRVTIKRTLARKEETREFPIQELGAIIVRRKHVVSFAGLAFLAAVATIIVRYNALWFLINLTPAEETTLSTVTLATTMLILIPTVASILFVDVTVTWGNKPESLLLRFVPTKQARNFARQFHAASMVN